MKRKANQRWRSATLEKISLHSFVKFTKPNCEASSKPCKAAQFRLQGKINVSLGDTCFVITTHFASGQPADGAAFRVARSGKQSDSGLLMLGIALVGIGGYAAYLLTRRGATPNDKRIRVEKHVTIDRPAAELYGFWRKLENLPQVMSHLESVTELDEKRSHWTAKAPLNLSVSWDAEITEDLENEIIAWRALEGSDIQNAGSVAFNELSHGRGTELRVVLAYEPPLGKVGATVARLMGEEPERQLQDDLRRFKQLQETGEIATIHGQPSGRA